MEHFVLPRNGMGIEIETEEGPISALVWTDYATNRESTGELEFRFAIIDPERECELSDLAFLGQGQGTLSSAWNAFSEAAASQADTKGLEEIGSELRTLARTQPKLLGGLINVILYILNDEDVVKGVHPGAKPRKKHARDPRKARRYQDLQDPDVFQVGRSFAAVIEHWEEDYTHVQASLVDERFDPICVQHMPICTGQGKAEKNLRSDSYHLLRSKEVIPLYLRIPQSRSSSSNGLVCRAYSRLNVR